MSKIGLVLLTPRSTGGAEMALANTRVGLDELGVSYDVLAPSNKEGEDWSNATKAMSPICIGRKDSAIDAFKDYDGLILSDTYFHNYGGATKTFINELVESPEIPTWVSANHWNSVAPTAVERHTRTKMSPSWCGSYVHFWPSSAVWDDCHWEQTVLPYLPKVHLRDHHAPLDDRPYDFLFAGRTDPAKGLTSFVSAMQRLTQIDPGRAYWARIAGVPNEMPGGPHIGVISLYLEEWGWEVKRDRPKTAAKWMKDPWIATHPVTGSTINYTGGYGPDELKGVLLSASTYINCTPWKLGREHLEFVTMEALETGMNVIAPDDWPDYQYGENRPVVTPMPMESFKIMKGKRIVYANRDPKALETSYGPLAETMMKLVHEKKNDPTVSTTAEAVRNRQILEEAHHPRRAAEAYLRALKI